MAEVEEWHDMSVQNVVDAAMGPGGTFAPVQTLEFWCGEKGFYVAEEDEVVHEVTELYCSTPVSGRVDTSLGIVPATGKGLHWLSTVGRLRIVDRVAYIDLD